MDNRASQNVKYIEKIIFYINDFFGNTKSVMLSIGEFRYYNPIKYDIQDDIALYPIKVNYENIVNDRYSEICNVFKQFILLYYHNDQSGTKETKLRSGYYLNKRFERIAKELGCHLRDNKPYGVTICKLPSRIEEYLDCIQFYNYNFYIPERKKINKKQNCNQKKYCCPKCGKGNGWYTTEPYLYCGYCLTDWFIKNGLNIKQIDDMMVKQVVNDD